MKMNQNKKLKKIYHQNFFFKFHFKKNVKYKKQLELLLVKFTKKYSIKLKVITSLDYSISLISMVKIIIFLLEIISTLQSRFSPQHQSRQLRNDEKTPIIWPLARRTGISSIHSKVIESEVFRAICELEGIKIL